MVPCCSVQPDLTSLSAELKKSFTFIAVAVDKENILIMEASTNYGKTAWPWTNEYIWKEYGSCNSYSLTSEDQNIDPFDIWKHDLRLQLKKLLCFTKQSTAKHIAREMI